MSILSLACIGTWSLSKSGRCRLRPGSPSFRAEHQNECARMVCPTHLTSTLKQSLRCSNNNISLMPCGNHRGVRLLEVVDYPVEVLDPRVFEVAEVHRVILRITVHCFAGRWRGYRIMWPCSGIRINTNIVLIEFSFGVV